MNNSRFKGRLEPETQNMPTEMAVYSIAISLKRIADVIEGGHPQKMSIFELIAHRMPSQ